MISVCGSIPIEIPILWPRVVMVGPRPRLVMVGHRPCVVMVGPRPCVVMVGPRPRVLLTPPLCVVLSRSISSYLIRVWLSLINEL
jgi:hypothetical protein